MSLASDLAKELTNYEPGSQRYDVPVFWAYNVVISAVSQALELAAKEAENGRALCGCTGTKELCEVCDGRGFLERKGAAERIRSLKG